MRAVTLTPNPDGTWMARIFGSVCTGTYQECVAWIVANGESVP